MGIHLDTSPKEGQMPMQIKFLLNFLPTKALLLRILQLHLLNILFLRLNVSIY